MPILPLANTSTQNIPAPTTQTTGTQQASTGNLGQQIIRDSNGNITGSVWDTNNPNNLPPEIRDQYQALQRDVERLRRESGNRTRELDNRIRGVESTIREEIRQLNKIADGFWTSIAAGIIGTAGGAFEANINACTREANNLRRQRTQQVETQERVDRLIREGNLSEAHAVLTNREQQFRQSMGNINGQTVRDLQGSNQQLTQTMHSATRWESNLRTARNICVVGGAIIATGGAASAGFIAAATAGTAAGTTIGAVSNVAQAESQVHHGNMTRGQAYEIAAQQTLQDAVTSVQIGVTGGLAGTTARGTGALLGQTRAATLTGRLTIGGTAGTTAGLTGSVLNTGTNIALGRETRTPEQIAVDTVTHTLLGTAIGTLGAGGQFRLDRLSQLGRSSALQTALTRGTAEVVVPTLLATGGTYASHALTGRECPTADEFVQNTTFNILGAHVSARVSSTHQNRGTVAPPPISLRQTPTQPQQRTIIPHEQLPASIRSSNAFQYANGNTRAIHNYTNRARRSIAVEVDSTLPRGSRPQAEVVVDPRTGNRTTRIRLNQEAYQRLQQGDQRALQNFQHELRHANRSNPVDVHVRDANGNITRTRSTREYIALRALEEFQVRAGRGAGQGPNNPNVQHTREVQRLINTGNYIGAIRYARQNGITPSDLRNYGSNYTANRRNPNQVIQRGNDSSRNLQEIMNEIQNNSNLADRLLLPGNEKILNLVSELAQPNGRVSPGEHFMYAARNAGFANSQEARTALNSFLNSNGGNGRILAREISRVALVNSPISQLNIPDTPGSSPNGQVRGIRSNIGEVEIVRNNDTGEVSISISNRVPDAMIHNNLLQRTVTNLRAGRSIHGMSELKVERTVGNRSLVCIHGRTNSRIWGVYDSSTGILTWGGVIPHGRGPGGWNAFIANWH